MKLMRDIYIIFKSWCVCYERGHERREEQQLAEATYKDDVILPYLDPCLITLVSESSKKSTPVPLGKL